MKPAAQASARQHSSLTTLPPEPRAIRVLPTEASGCQQLWDAHERQERSVRIFASSISEIIHFTSGTSCRTTLRVTSTVKSHQHPRRLPPDVRVSVSPKSPRSVHGACGRSSQFSLLCSPDRPINHISSLSAIIPHPSPHC